MVLIQGCKQQVAPTHESLPTATTSHNGSYKGPKVIMPIVIDQFAYHYLEKLKPYLTGGLKFLMNNSVSYHNAHHPHGTPSTAPGHTALSTGAFADMHGIIDNTWMDQNGKTFSSVEDDSPEAQVISPNGFYDFGRGPSNIKVDTFCDQFMLYSSPEIPHHAVSLSFKDRAAVCMCGRLGKAFWVDDKEGTFTSSKPYFTQLPDWVKEFNAEHGIKSGDQFTWKTVYPENHKAYNFDKVNNYEYSGYAFKLVNKELTIDLKSKDGCELYEKTPFANELVSQLAQQYISTQIDPTKPDRHMIWVSFSSLDKVGHFYGPYAREAIDTIYHLDRQLKELMDFTTKKLGKGNVLFVLTADHGVMPIPEILQKQGMSLARRVIADDITNALNAEIESRHSIKKLVDHYNTPAFNFNKKVWSEIGHDKQKAIIATIKAYLLAQPGFQRVWTFDELYNLPARPGTIDYNFKRQLYKNRSGEIICRLQPYFQITKYKTGTTHSTPYGYDTQVPMMIYQEGQIQKKRIYKQVSSLQLVPTLASILSIPKPSAACEKPFPGLPVN